MEIIFDPRPGEVYDIFASLWLMNNLDFAIEVEKSFGHKVENKYRKMICSVIKNEIADMNTIKRFFYKELEPNSIVSSADIWRYPTIESYLEFIENFDELEIRKKIVKIMFYIMNEKKDQDQIEKLAIDDNTVLNYIENKDINIGLKWEFYLFIKNKQNYLKEFIECVKGYLDVYKVIDVQRKNVMTDFDKEFEEKIERFGLDYINKVINCKWPLEKFEKIYVTTSANIAYYIEYFQKENVCYLVVGPSANERIIETQIENNLTIIRNATDNTRFQIIKILLERDHYSQEISKILGINKGTISRHMSILINEKIVNIKRKGQRMYYSINKDVLRKCVGYLTNEWKL